MQWTVNKLSIVVGILSVIVLYESVYILTSLMNREKTLDVQPEVPKEVIERMNAEASAEANQFKEEFLAGEETAELKLVPVVCEGCEQQRADIYLVSDMTVKSVSVKLVVPMDVEIIDQVDGVDGVQILYGDADVYLKNVLLNDTVELDVLFDEGFAGEMKLGQVVYANRLGSEATFEFDFQPDLLSGSYATSFDTGKNILIKPESYTF